MTENKYKNLALSLLFDGIGMLSYVIPGFGEITDAVWAPISAWLMTKMYKGNVGKAAGLFSLVEEAIPGMDFIPTFTLMWLYTYVIKKTDAEADIIEVDAS